MGRSLRYPKMFPLKVGETQVETTGAGIPGALGAGTAQRPTLPCQGEANFSRLEPDFPHHRVPTL